MRLNILHPGDPGRSQAALVGKKPTAAIKPIMAAIPLM
jgi:hypothetical protein